MNQVRHPFFHAMVVVSSALVSCGGNASDVGEDVEGSGGTDASDAGEDVDSSGGTDASGDSGGQGAGAGDGSGGLGGTGGSVQSTGGAAATVVPPELGCPTEQWICDANSTEIIQRETASGMVVGYTLPDGCECDESRPTSPDDCQLGEQFTCWGMAFLDADTAFDQVYPLGCECPKVEDCSACRDLEPAVAGYADGFSCEKDAQQITLCGAGFVYLR